MRWTLCAAVLAGVAMPGSATAGAAPPLVPRALTVCLTMSPLLVTSGSEEAGLLSEANAIWRPLGLSIRLKGRRDDSCDRLVTVSSDLEARHGDAAAATALAWVPFIEGRARQIVYLRVRLARTMLHERVPGTRNASLAVMLLPKFLGRILAHELGHVLLNTIDHTTTGLMRARYHAHDVLRDPSSAYGLSAEQRDRLLATLDWRREPEAR